MISETTTTEIPPLTPLPANKSMYLFGGLAPQDVAAPSTPRWHLLTDQATAAFVVGTLDILSASGGGGGATRIRWR
jgi:hypothetical protein